jgi:tetratricopeptide (TPR) repeat protein
MTQETTQQAFESALQHHQAGRLPEAAELYRQVLSGEPDHVVSLHHLGLIALQSGRPDVALQLIGRSVAVNSDYADAHLSLGNILKSQGRCDEAIAAYRQAVAARPDMAGAHLNLGIALRGLGRLDGAVAAYRGAIAANPSFAEAHNNLGNALRDQGQLDEAIAAYRRAVSLRPDYAEALNHLGMALIDKGQIDEAVTAWRQVITIDPKLPEVYLQLANALKDKGQFDEAIAAYRQAIALRPGHAEAHSCLGHVLKDNGQVAEAIAVYRQAIALGPEVPGAYVDLGNALKESGQLDDAIAAYRHAIELKPDYSEACNNLGNALQAMGRVNDAIDSYRRAIDLGPGNADAHSNLGVALNDMGLTDDAVAAWRRAIEIKPDLPDAHFNLGFALLARGDFERGWEEYEWRRNSKSFPSARRTFAEPQWDGGPLAGRTILVHAEQGFGDTLQFIRYLPFVVQQGARVVIECPAGLPRLLHRFAGNCQIVLKGQPLPAFDLHCPLLSLPRLFGTTLASVPDSVPYLHAADNDAARWQARLADHSKTMKVGLAWAGSSVHKNDRNRSMRLAAFAPLWKVPGVRFFSLQLGEPAAQVRAAPPGMEIVDVTGELEDFADTAALIANLDLVIAVDTAVAHLAGAMGKPVWTLLPFVADWRWLLGREDSPWYPSMRLFRQPIRGDWDSVVKRVVEELSRGVRDRG